METSAAAMKCTLLSKYNENHCTFDHMHLTTMDLSKTRLQAEYKIVSIWQGFYMCRRYAICRRYLFCLNVIETELLHVV